MDNKFNDLVELQEKNLESKANNTITYKNTENNNKNENENNYSQINMKEELRSNCMSIFLNFAKFSNEEKEFFISFQSLVKLMRTVNLISPKTLKSSDIDILLKKCSPKSQKLDSEQFLNFIVLLANKLDNKNFVKDPRLTIMKTVQTYFDPLKQYIDDKTNENQDNIIFANKYMETRLNNVKFDDSLIKIIDSIYEGLKFLYSSYFFYEINNFNNSRKVITESLNALIEFCKDFEICPFFLKTDKIAIFFNLILGMTQEEITKNGLIFEEHTEIGNIFTLSKFVAFFVHIGLLSYDKIGSISEFAKTRTDFEIDMAGLNNSEKLLMFLEAMETGKGIDKAKQRQKKTFNSKISLLPNKEIIYEINPDFLYILEQKAQNLSVNLNKATNNPIKFIRNIEADNNLDLHEIFGTDNPEVIEKLDKNLEILKDLFEDYASIGDKLDFSFMNLSGFSKFLKDANLIRQPKTNNKLGMSMSRSMSQAKFKPADNNMSRLNMSNYNLKKSPSTFSTVYDGKLIESEISIIFSQICGQCNFDSLNTTTNSNNSFAVYSNNVKNQFDKVNSIRVHNKVTAFKMNFALFLKSLEILALKLHPTDNIDDALIYFIDIDIAQILKERAQHSTSKQNILEVVKHLKQDDIVNNYIILDRING